MNSDSAEHLMLHLNVRGRLLDIFTLLGTITLQPASPMSYKSKTMFPDTKTLFAASEIHLNYTVYQEIQVHKKMQIVTNKRYTCQLLLPCNLMHNGFTLTVNIIHCNGYRVRNCAEVIKWFCGAGTKPKLPVILKKVNTFAKCSND